MKLLFITRAYPPRGGGMERLASDFYDNYRRIGDIELLANTGGRKTFPFFVIKAAFYIMFKARKYEVVHVYDAVLAPLIPIIRLFSRAKISFTVNGLDIVYSRFGYQKFMPFFLKRADKVIAVSNHTRMECVARGIPDEIVSVIPNGVNFEKIAHFSDQEKSRVLQKFDIQREGKKVLLTTGRLIKRKGHAWFLENVLKKLPENYIYIVIGCGPEEEAIRQAIDELDLTERVYMLGYVTDEEKNCLYQISDVFVMPNIKIANDQEGFGIVLIEAGSYGLPVVASRIEGITDAVVDGKSGRLINEKDSQAFIQAILNPNLDRNGIRRVVESNFDAQKMVKRYAGVFQALDGDCQ